MKKLPCKTIVWQKLWGKRPSVIHRWWFLIVYFYQHTCKAGSLCLAKLGKVCKATQATPALVPELWALWNEGSDTNTATLCSDPWAYNSPDWQHWHCTFGSVFWPTLGSKLGFTNSLLSHLSQAALLHYKLFPPLQRLIFCSVLVWSVNHQLWENSTCSDVSIYSLWFYDGIGGGRSTHMGLLYCCLLEFSLWFLIHTSGSSRERLSFLDQNRI